MNYDVKSPSPPQAQKLQDKQNPQRIAKIIARSGFCSRRDAEKLILAGRVTYDGDKVITPAINVAYADRISIDGKKLAPIAATRLWRYHKPKGLVSSARDEQGRPTIFSQMPANIPHMISVGRLDLNSEGLLLLTNNGELARSLELPKMGFKRHYRVRVHGVVAREKLASLKAGITIDGFRYGAIEAALEKQQSSNAWIKVTLAEGKNREIRRIMTFLGYPVNRLIRIGFGPFLLDKLAIGQVEEIPPATWQKFLGDYTEIAGLFTNQSEHKISKKQQNPKPIRQQNQKKSRQSNKPRQRNPDQMKD